MLTPKSGGVLGIRFFSPSGIEFSLGLQAQNAILGASSSRRCLPMFKPLVFPGLAEFVAATTGRNMTKSAYVAVIIGVLMVVLLTLDPAYEAARQWANVVLWGCLGFFAFEWAVRIRHAATMGRAFAYLLSGRGLVDAACATAVPLALLLGADARS